MFFHTVMQPCKGDTHTANLLAPICACSLRLLVSPPSIQSRMEALADQLNKLKAQLEDTRVREKNAQDRASEMEQVGLCTQMGYCKLC